MEKEEINPASIIRYQSNGRICSGYIIVSESNLLKIDSDKKVKVRVAAPIGKKAFIIRLDNRERIIMSLEDYDKMLTEDLGCKIETL